MNYVDFMDAMTQLAKEFLEVHGYIVSTSVKMRLRGRKSKRTESDIDIVAHRYKRPVDFGNLPYDKTLADYIIAEVKGTYVGVDKSYFKDIKNSKFDKWNKKYLRRYAPTTSQKVLFCSRTTKEVKSIAEKKGIKILTAIHMLKILSQIINQKEEKQNTYYPERPIYSSLRILLDFLGNPDETYSDALLLDDLLLWMMRPKHKKYRRRFIGQNWEFLINLVYPSIYTDSHGVLLDKLIEKMRNEDWWKFYYSIKDYVKGAPKRKRSELINKLMKYR